jgi:hypothetical protein
MIWLVSNICWMQGSTSSAVAPSPSPPLLPHAPQNSRLRRHLFTTVVRNEADYHLDWKRKSRVSCSCRPRCESLRETRFHSASPWMHQHEEYVTGKDEVLTCFTFMPLPPCFGSDLRIPTSESAAKFMCGGSSGSQVAGYPLRSLISPVLQTG